MESGERNDVVAEEEGEGEGAKDQGDRDEGAFELAMGTVIEAMLEKGDDLAKPHDGMWQALGVAENQIAHPTNYY